MYVKLKILFVSFLLNGFHHVYNNDTHNIILTIFNLYFINTPKNYPQLFIYENSTKRH